MENKNELIIVGGGIAGAAAALRASQNGMTFLWVLGNRLNQKKSRAKWVYNIDNMIGIHPSIVLEKVVKKHPDLQIETDKHKYPISTQDIINNAIQRVRDFSQEAARIEACTVTKATGRDENSLFQLTLEDDKGNLLSQEKGSFVVLAQGLMDTQPIIYKTVNGKDLFKTAWIYPFANRETALYCARCEGHLTKDKKLVMVGSGKNAILTAMLLYERYKSVQAIITNGTPLEATAEERKILKHYGIETFEDKIVDIVTAKESKTEFNGFTLSSGKTVLCDFSYLSLGVYEVYNKLATDLSAALEENKKPLKEKRVLVDQNGETSVPNLFSVGDMATHKDRSIMMQVYTAQEYAVRAIDTIDRRIRWAKREQISKT